jgi:hypothetical protein
MPLKILNSGIIDDLTRESDQEFAARCKENASIRGHSIQHVKSVGTAQARTDQAMQLEIPADCRAVQRRVDEIAGREYRGNASAKEKPYNPLGDMESPLKLKVFQFYKNTGGGAAGGSAADGGYRRRKIKRAVANRNGRTEAESDSEDDEEEAQAKRRAQEELQRAKLAAEADLSLDNVKMNKHFNATRCAPMHTPGYATLQKMVGDADRRVLGMSLGRDMTSFAVEPTSKQATHHASKAAFQTDPASESLKNPSMTHLMSTMQTALEGGGGGGERRTSTRRRLTDNHLNLTTAQTVIPEEEPGEDDGVYVPTVHGLMDKMGALESQWEERQAEELQWRRQETQRRADKEREAARREQMAGAAEAKAEMKKSVGGQTRAAEPAAGASDGGGGGSGSGSGTATPSGGTATPLRGGKGRASGLFPSIAGVVGMVREQAGAGSRAGSRLASRLGAKGRAAHDKARKKKEKDLGRKAAGSAAGGGGDGGGKEGAGPAGRPHAPRRPVGRAGGAEGGGLSPRSGRAAAATGGRRGQRPGARVQRESNNNNDDDADNNSKKDAGTAAALVRFGLW